MTQTDKLWPGPSVSKSSSFRAVAGETLHTSAYIPSLDGLRAISILLIFSTHAGFRHNPRWLRSDDVLLRQRWRRYVVHEPPVIPLLIRQKLERYRDPFGR